MSEILYDFIATMNENKELKQELSDLKRQVLLTKVAEQRERELREGLEDQITAMRGALTDTQESINLAVEMLSDYKNKFHDYDVPENTEDDGPRGKLHDIETHLLGTSMGIDEVLEGK